MNIIMIVFAVGFISGLFLIFYHLVHAPVGEESSEGFKALSSPKSFRGESADSTATPPTFASRI
jgi:hypothetical protein